MSATKIVLAGVVVLGLGGVGYRSSIEQPIPVRTAALEKNVEVRVFGTGTVEAQITSRVGFQINGKLVFIVADQGDFVEAGALLARIDDDAPRAKLMKSEAAQRQAAAVLKRALAHRDRAEVSLGQKKSANLRRQSLANRGAVSRETADESEAAELIAMGDVVVAEADATIAAALREDTAAQVQLDRALVAQHELRAPFDSRVIMRHRELGSAPKAGEPIFTLIAPDSIWIRTPIDESRAGGLTVGQTAFVQLRSEPDHVVESEVVRIDPENDRANEGRRVYVRCRNCGPNHQMRYLGEQADVEIVKNVIERGVFVPESLIQNFNGRIGSIWVLQNGRLAKQLVRFGERLMDDRVQVVSDLPPDMLVVIDERNDLREGRPARAR